MELILWLILSATLTPTTTAQLTAWLIFMMKKIQTKNVLTIKNAVKAIHFDTDTGIIDEVDYKILNNGTSTSSFCFRKNGTLADPLPYVTTKNAKFDYGLEMDKGDSLNLGGYLKGGVNYNIEGWFYVDTSLDSDTGTLFHSELWSSSGYQCDIIKIYYSYTKDENGIVIPKLTGTDYSKTNTELPEGTFDKPFHFYHGWRWRNSPVNNNMKLHYFVYINGKLIVLTNLSGSNIAVAFSYQAGATLRACNIGEKTFRGVLSEFKITMPATEFYDYDAETNTIFNDFEPPTKSSIAPRVAPVVENLAIQKPETIFKCNVNAKADDSTIALLHFDESISKDECGNTWKVYGTPILSDGALYLDTNCALLLSDLNLVSTEYTVDYWLYSVSSSASYTYVGWVGDNIIAQTGTMFRYYNVSNNISYKPLAKKWTHIAIVNTASNMIVFADGVKQGTLPSSPNITKIGIGYQINSSCVVSDMFYIDEFRISNKALWTEDFTPPEQPAVVERLVTPKTYYVPFVENKADTTTPCLATRHNGKVYYAIK